MSAVPAIRLNGLTKKFGTVTAVDNVNLEVGEGEFFSMLGPSGSGKTTVLRMIAGFEQPDSGTVELFGKDVTASAPFDRDVNTVFQDYALFPHMSVIENVAYGLRVRRINQAERTKQAQDALEMVQLGSYGDRKPSQLSGGQRQRVALARSIVVQPKVLLLDEPLGALDLKLREQMQVELKEIQRKLGITFIFVTHDQEEALTLSDRIAVFNNGKIVQLGTAEDVYRNPANEFVANFVGTSNIFNTEQATALLGHNSACSIRPEKIIVSSPGTVPNGSIALNGIIAETIFLGASTRIVIDLESGKRIYALEPNDDEVSMQHRRGDAVTTHFQASSLVELQ